MYRFEIINKLIKDNNYKSYLEIGVNNGINLRMVNCDTKVGVDPEPKVRIYTPECNILTSDKFFEINKRKFDIIFVDGLHEANQVYKDIINSLEVLNDGGTIVCHDMKPRSYEAQLVPRIQKVWNGDCWKAFVKLRQERNDLEMFVVDTDEGCGIIKKGTQTKLEIKEEINYDNFVKNQKEWLNLISINDFLNK